MICRKFKNLSCLTLAIVISAAALPTYAQEDAPEPKQMASIKLALPRLDHGKLLMQALKDRHSQRTFSPRPLPNEILSDLLWAAFGINREKSGLRTAPSVVNWQEIEIYVAMKSGVYLYDPKNNILQPILDEDIRAMTGVQEFTQIAPVNLIYVADYNKMTTENEQDKDFYSAADTGFISQNVYLYCASEGLATVIVGWVDKTVLAQKMDLPEHKKVILTQPVGYAQ